jgi:predicted DNA-binding antitoxin AbrB/MazE fold protein
MKICRGVVKGNTIVLGEPVGLPDGQRVEVEIRAIEKSRREKYGIEPIISAGGKPVTNELVNELREELGI